MPKDLQSFPKWRNFAKSGHTVTLMQNSQKRIIKKAESGNREKRGTKKTLSMKKREFFTGKTEADFAII